MSLTALAAIKVIMSRRWERNVVLPNFTPPNWWECDVFELTKAGYFREYEVKMTRSDFAADANKQRRVYSGFNLEPYRPSESRVLVKHERLAARDVIGPTRFWFVTPAGLIKPSELPEWAGLIELTDWNEKAVRPCWRWQEKEVVPAPKLHRIAAASGIDEAAKMACYYRMHRLMRGEPVEAALEARA